MLLPTMTLSEMKREIDKDYLVIFKIVIEANNRGKRLAQTNILKYPYTIKFQKKSYKTNITYTCCLNVPTKYRRRDPFMVIYTHFHNDFGYTFFQINPTPPTLELQLFTTHFLKRYRERMHVADDVSMEDSFIQFRLINGYSRELDSMIVDNEEKYYHDEDTEYFGCVVPEGAIICERDKNEPLVTVHNTFVSRDMFFRSQLEESKIAYNSMIWGNFIEQYPPQREKLIQVFDKYAKESKDEDELNEKLSKFIENY